ncbi:hypothetical protein B0H16DRAFT_1447475 [Mycena metata]|uniref:Uncharacterized protein n=1 Tax=Mycena metata TaxID=1033252 RepID=A0AAD7K8Z1_9AGAR|nr:hypothetical protein B0H16DRAFT_1447475 [Mycena metata]
MLNSAAPAATPRPAHLSLNTMEALNTRLKNMETELRLIHTFTFPLAARVLIEKAVDVLGDGLAIKPRPRKIRNEDNWDPSIVYGVIEQLKTGKALAPHEGKSRKDAALELIQDENVMELLFGKPEEDESFNRQFRAYDDEVFHGYCRATHLPPAYQVLLQRVHSFITPEANPLEFA